MFYTIVIISFVKAQTSEIKRFGLETIRLVAFVFFRLFEMEYGINRALFET